MVTSREMNRVMSLRHMRCATGCGIVSVGLPLSQRQARWSSLAPLRRCFFCGRTLCNRLGYGVGGFAFTRLGQTLARNLAPLRRGFFVRASPPACCATNGAARRWWGGLAAVAFGLWTGGRPPSDSLDQLSPAPWRGFCLGTSPLRRMPCADSGGCYARYLAGESRTSLAGGKRWVSRVGG